MLHIDEQYAKEMVAHALKEDPNECCGILAGKDGQVLELYSVTNVEASPYRYKMDPQEQFKVDLEIGDSGWDIIAFYHSHTHSEAYPSDTDVRMATWQDGTSLWPGVRYILISLLDKENPPIRAFHIEDGSITEEAVIIRGAGR
jgi:proteasome lid subunit RPN8/RPN11